MIGVKERKLKWYLDTVLRRFLDGVEDEVLQFEVDIIDHEGVQAEIFTTNAGSWGIGFVHLIEFNWTSSGQVRLRYRVHLDGEADPGKVFSGNAVIADVDFILHDDASLTLDEVADAFVVDWSDKESEDEIDEEPEDDVEEEP